MGDVKPMFAFWGINIPLGANGVNLVDENDARCVLLSHTEQFPNEFWTVTEVLLNQLRSHHTQERRRRLICDGLGEQCLSGTRYSV